MATSWHSCLEDSETADLRNGAEKELQDEMALPLYNLLVHLQRTWGTVQ